MDYAIVSTSDKKILRDRFIKEFINTNHEYFRKYIGTLRKYPDGLCYDGYLWDVLNEAYDNSRVLQEKAITLLKSKSLVYVMWDIYSNYRVVMNDIIRLNNPKDTIISVNANELCDLIEYEWAADWDLGERYLPEDIYIFDNSMNWCIIFTHEGDDSTENPNLNEDDYIRVCFMVDRTK